VPYAWRADQGNAEPRVIAVVPVRFGAAQAEGVPAARRFAVALAGQHDEKA
jgi:hypothetical protein